MSTANGVIGQSSTQTARLTSIRSDLVGTGFRQREGVDYEQTFSPILKFATTVCFLKLLPILTEDNENDALNL